MSHANKADRLLIKPAAGARPASPCTRGRIIRKARTQRAASHPKSHTRHGDTRLATAPDRPTRVSQSPEAWQKQAIRIPAVGDALNHPAAQLCYGAERG